MKRTSPKKSPVAKKSAPATKARRGARPTPKYEMFRTKHKGKQVFSWRLVGANGQLQSGPLEPFASRRNALRSIAAHRIASVTERVVDLT